MELNNFGDIVTFTKKRCNISDTTDFDDIINTAINGTYINLKKKEPALVTAIVPSLNKIAQLPEDLDSIIEISPGLNADEYRLGQNLVLKRDDTFTIIYTTIPEYLTDKEIPEISKKYWYALSTYGCYAYYNYKKKLNEGQAYYQEYLSQLSNAEPNDQTQIQIQNVYSAVLY